jgi:two-component system OmpR family response regulator
MPMEQTLHVLVVDDHREIRDLVGRFLKKEGFRVSEAGDGREMRKLLAASRIDLIILDLMLPGEDGLSLCREVRAKSAVPIIMLTAKGEEIDKVIGLEMGADDYLAKPFGTRELLARIKAVLRRTTALPGASPAEKPSGFRFAGWRLDTARRELVGSDGVVTPLSTGEYDLLIAFIEHPHRVLTRDQLLDIARGRESVAFDRSIDTQVSRLRRKIERDPRNPEIIKTVWGGGYTFTPEIEAE